MPRPGWLNENSHRSFPLQKDQEESPALSTTIPNDVVVDAGFVMGQSSGYVEGEHTIWLESVARGANTLTFTFQTDAPGCSGAPLVFTRDLTDKDATEHVSVLYQG